MGPKNPPPPKKKRTSKPIPKFDDHDWFRWLTVLKFSTTAVRPHLLKVFTNWQDTKMQKQLIIDTSKQTTWLIDVLMHHTSMLTKIFTTTKMITKSDLEWNPERGVDHCKNLESLVWKESLESHQNLRNLLESDKNLRNLIRIFGITWKSVRESFRNPWNL